MVKVTEILSFDWSINYSCRRGYLSLLSARPSGREERTRLPPPPLHSAHAREQPGVCCFSRCSRSLCRSVLWLMNPEEPELWERSSPLHWPLSPHICPRGPAPALAGGGGGGAAAGAVLPAADGGGRRGWAAALPAAAGAAQGGRGAGALLGGAAAGAGAGAWAGAGPGSPGSPRAGSGAAAGGGRREPELPPGLCQGRGPGRAAAAAGTRPCRQVPALGLRLGPAPGRGQPWGARDGPWAGCALGTSKLSGAWRPWWGGISAGGSETRAFETKGLTFTVPRPGGYGGIRPEVGLSDLCGLFQPNWLCDCVTRAQRVPRTGWVYRKVADPESVSDHMYRMAMMALVTEDKSLNKDRWDCLRLSRPYVNVGELQTKCWTKLSSRVRAFKSHWRNLKSFSLYPLDRVLFTWRTERG